MPAPDLLTPAFLLVPERDYTFGPAVGELCASAGFAPDPEQQLILDAVFGEVQGMPAAREGLLVGPRQNFKSAVLEMIALGWMFVTNEPGVVMSAHQHKTIRGTFDHLCMLIERTPALRRYLAKEPIKSVGDEAIVLRDPDGTERFLMFATRSGRGYRGRSFGKLILDEYLYVQAGHEGALFPTQTTFPDWQRIGATSAGLPESDRARALRDRGRPMDRAAEPRFLYFEMCDDLPGVCRLGTDCTHVYGTIGCRYDDPARWERANFGVARGRITLDYIASERRSMSAEEFGRERNGYWDDPAAGSLPVFSEETWDGLRDRHSSVPDAGMVFGLHVSPLRDWSAIAFGGRTGAGRVHVETASRSKGGVRTYFRRPSTDWVVPWFRSRLEPAKGKPKFDGMTLVVWAGTAVDSLLPKLSEIRGLDIVELPRGEQPAACGHFQDLVSGGDLVHVGDPEMRASVTSIVRRPMGESSFVWSPRSSAGDITAAYAATGIAWHLANTEEYDPLDSVG